MAEPASAPAVPAATPAVEPTGTPAAAPAVEPTGWTEGLAPELKSFAETKGWKDPGEVVSGYRNLEKLTGVPADQLIRMPKTDDAEGMGKLYDRLGRPESPDGYTVPVPEGQTDEFAKTAAGWFHEVGLSGAQATKLTETWNNYTAEQNRVAQEEYQASVAADEVALKTEWGAAHEKNIQIAKSAAQAFGVEAATVDKLEQAMGFAGLVKFMHSLGAQLGEDKFLTGDGPGGFGGMSPAMAQAKLQDLKGDPSFVKRYTGGDAAAKAEMERLHKLAYPESA